MKKIRVVFYISIFLALKATNTKQMQTLVLPQIIITPAYNNANFTSRLPLRRHIIAAILIPPITLNRPER